MYYFSFQIASVENDTSSCSARGGYVEDKKSEKSQNGEVDYKKVRQFIFFFLIYEYDFLSFER